MPESGLEFACCWEVDGFVVPATAAACGGCGNGVFVVVASGGGVVTTSYVTTRCRWTVVVVSESFHITSCW